MVRTQNRDIVIFKTDNLNRCTSNTLPIKPDKMWKGKDGMEDDKKGEEDDPKELVEQIQVWPPCFYQTLIKRHRFSFKFRLKKTKHT